MRGSGRSGGGSHGGATAAGAIRNRGGIAQRMVLATVALALVVGAVFAILLLTIEDARNAERSALHSQNVLIAANGLELRVLDLETGQRGFILTRQMEFLVPWQQALATLPQEGLALLKLVTGDPAQEARVREIVTAARSYIDDYSVPLVNAAARDDPSARTIAATAEGEARVDAIRADFAQLFDAERRTSAATARASTEAAHRAYAGAVVGIGVSIALVALYAGYLTRAIVRPIRRAATLTGRVASGDLAARLSETGVGEIGALQRAFNVMGASLERSHDELAALADEQAGLRRVATLVAQGASADDVLAAVAREIGQLLPADYALIGRYDVQGSEITTVGSWNRDADSAGFPTTSGIGGRNVTALVWQTGRPARMQPDETASGPVAPYGRALGIRSCGRRPHQRRRAPVGHRDRRVHPRGTDAGRHGDPARQLHRARLDRHRERRGAGGADRITRAHHRYRRRDQTPFRARSARRRPATVRHGRDAGARGAGSGATRSPRARR